MPAGAVIQKPQVLPGIIGRKAFVGGLVSLMLNLSAQPKICMGNGKTRGQERCVELIE